MLFIARYLDTLAGVQLVSRTHPPYPLDGFGLDDVVIDFIKDIRFYRAMLAQSRARRKDCGNE